MKLMSPWYDDDFVGRESCSINGYVKRGNVVILLLVLREIYIYILIYWTNNFDGYDFY